MTFSVDRIPALLRWQLARRQSLLTLLASVVALHTVEAVVVLVATPLAATGRVTAQAEGVDVVVEQRTAWAALDRSES